MVARGGLGQRRDERAGGSRVHRGRGAADSGRRALRLLLDTHALIWFTGSPDLLEPAARKAIVAADVAAVSAASIWEVSTKMRLGKLRPPSESLLDELEEWSFALLPITARHAWAAGALPLHHRDPFDRMLVAQAQLEGLTIVTRDPAIARYQVAVLPA